MMTNNKKSVTIIGGGTAGYMSAAFFVHQGYDVTIIYNNSDNPRLVVGESLTSNTFHFLEEMCGFKRKEWMTGSDAIFKNGVLYKNWGKDGEVFFNTWRSELHNEIDYINNKDSSYQDIIDTTIYKQQLSDTNKTLFTKDDLENPLGFNGQGNREYFIQNAGSVPFGVQLDAIQLTEFIKSKLKDRIVTIHKSVASVQYNGNDVSSITLDDGEILDVELIIDASGFAKVISKTSPLFKEEDISHLTFPNRALFGVRSYDNIESEMKPRTGAFCGKHGWSWHTPTAKRVGTGYIFNSNYCTDDEAVEDYAKILNIPWDEVDVNFINFPSKRTKDVMMGNVLSIGMSSGFIEPMEAPALLGVQLSLGYFITQPDKVNLKMREYVYSMCAFIGIRYKTASNKGTPFWDYVENKEIKFVDDIMQEYKTKGYTDAVGAGGEGCMPPRCFDDLIRSSLTPTITDTSTTGEYLSMYDYLKL